MERKTLKMLLYIAIYGIAIFAANYFCSVFCVSFIQLIFVPIAGKMPYVLLMIVVLLVYILFELFLPLLFVHLAMRYTVPRQYVLVNGNRPIACFLIQVLPMEVLRYLVCLSSLGHISSTGFFASLTSLVFENTYIRWSGRHDQIRVYLDYIPEDYLAYTLCYLIYAAIYLTFVVLIYRKHWKVGKEESEELVVYEKNQRLY